MSLTTLSALARKLEKAEKVLAEREKNKAGAYVILYSDDSDAEVEAKRQAVLGDRDPAKYVIEEHWYEAGPAGYVLPGQGDTSGNGSLVQGDIHLDDVRKQNAAAKSHERLAADDEQARKEGRETSPRGYGRNR
jgi:hypothetical protein